MPLFLPAWLAVACLVLGSFDLSHASSAIKADPASDKIAKREDIAVDGSQFRSNLTLNGKPGPVQSDPHSWPPSIPVPYFPHVSIDFTVVKPLRDQAQIDDMHTALVRMQQLVCANRQSQKVNQIHTATSLTVSCPDIGRSNQQHVLHWAMVAMRQGQASRVPAALSGRIITTGHPEELWTEFKTIVQGVPPVPTPGWGTNTWCSFNLKVGNLAPMQIRMLSQGPVADKWYSYFTFALLLQLFKHLHGLPDQGTTAAKPIDIRQVPQGIRFRLRPYHHGSTEFTVEQEVLVLYALMQSLKDREARDLTISVIVSGTNVAVGYLDVVPPPLDSSAKNSTGVEVKSSTILTVDMNGSHFMSPQVEPSIARQLDILSARSHVEQVCGQ